MHSLPSETRVLRLRVHLCRSQHLTDAYTAEKAPHRSHLHIGGVVCALSARVLHPAVPPHQQRAAPRPPHGCSVRRGQGLGHCRGTASNVKPGLTAAAASFARSLASDFFSRCLLPYLKSLLIIRWLLFNAVDWSSSFFTCKLLSLGRHLQRVLGASFTPHFFPLFLP